MNRSVLIKVLLLSVCLLFNTTVSTYIYSFLPMLAVDFGLAATTTTSGKTGAWIASAMMVGRTLTAPLWGIYADKYGRKKGLLSCLFLVSLFSLLFGFATNIWHVYIIRFLLGASNGLSVIGKILTTEICPPEDKSLSVSITSTIWNLGGIFGTFWGAIFYKTIPERPYLGSSIAVAILGFVLILLSIIIFEETLFVDKTKKDIEEVELVPKVNTSESEEINETSSIIRHTKLK